MSNPSSRRRWAIRSANPPALQQYILALILVAIAVALRTWLSPLLGHPSVAVFMAAILVGAWVGGIGPALVCLVLLHIVHGYWFQNPPGLFEPTIASVVTTTGWYAVGITVGILSQKRTAAQRRERDQQLEALSQREQLRAILACMAESVVVTDVNGRLTLMNPAAEALTGWSTAQSHGRPWQELFTIRCETSQSEVNSPIARALSEGQVVQESRPLLLLSRTGRTIPIAYSAAPVKSMDGEITGVVLVFRDESEPRRNQLALRDADRRKDEFLATLAHELRNPLAPICTGFDLLQLSAHDVKASDEIRSMMQRQAHHMVRLIDDLLDVARITSGRLELRKSQVELAGIVRDAIAASQPLLDEAGHDVIVRLPEQPLQLYVDASRLTQVLTNLLNNAAKYTPGQGCIELDADRTGDDVRITVSDSGIGIPREKISSVFDMFTQVHESQVYGRRGLGIGLTLVKRLVEMHGGRVEVQSREPSPGTSFTIVLPMFAEPETIPSDGRPSWEDLPVASRRVLVVDDNADALDSLSRLVSLLGNEVCRARDGLEAVEFTRTFRPDVILMDLGMPNLNGYEAARRIRQEPWGRNLMLVATTGWGQDDDRRRTAEAGFDRHLVKPIVLAAIREVLDAAPRT